MSASLLKKTRRIVTLHLASQRAPAYSRYESPRFSLSLSLVSIMFFTTFSYTIELRKKLEENVALSARALSSFFQRSLYLFQLLDDNIKVAIKFNFGKQKLWLERRP